MKPNRIFHLPCGILPAVTALLLVGASVQPCSAYDDYSGCTTCHGNFRGSTSTKGTVFPNNNNHDMHRNAAFMDTECNLCHIGPDRTPVRIGVSTGTTNNAGLGCVGCHVAEGLRAHHAANGVSECAGCHTDGPAPRENVQPPYYGTPDTKVNNPGNTVLAANTNENWSVGDFLGLDNDGNNLYDLADYAIGPFRLLGVNREGDDFRISWLTAGGRRDAIQAAGAVSGSFFDVGTSIDIPGVGLVTTNFLEVGGATNLARFYRLKAATP
jgi:hypothetical protein